MNHFFFGVNDWRFCVRCGHSEWGNPPVDIACTGFPEGMRPRTDEMLLQQGRQTEVLSSIEMSPGDFLVMILKQLGISEGVDEIEEKFGIPPISCSQRRNWENKVMAYNSQRRKDNG